MRKLQKYIIIAKTSLITTFAYPESLITGAILYAMLTIILSMLWRSIYGSGNGIPGYSINQMIWYLIITEIVYSSRAISFEDVNSDVKSGNIAYLVNKPYSYIFYLLSNSIGQFGGKLVITIITGIIVGICLVGPLNNLNIAYLPFAVFSGVLAILLNFFMLVILALLAFWTEENKPFRWIYSKLILIFGVLLPIEFFPHWAQPIIRKLPFPYTCYAPAKLTVDFSFKKFAEIITMQLIYLTIFILLAIWVYNKGVKKLNVNGG